MAMELPQPSFREFPPIASASPADDNDRPILPPIGLDISRPPSTSSQTSSHYIPRRPSPNPGLQLPGLSQLSALASAASSRRGSPDSVGTQGSSHIQFRVTLPPPDMASASMGATIGVGGAPPLCQNCGTNTTPLWRRDENGTVLCNACGLFLKLHGRPRPISLKTNVIKSRNRVRTQPGLKQKDGTTQSTTKQTDGSISNVQRTESSQQVAAHALQRSNSPLSRAGTPGNIAPQSMFDSVTLDPSHAFYPTSLQDSNIRTASPRPENSAGFRQLEGHLSYEVLLKEATKMQTRINELDVINGLFRGRIEELESAKEEVRRQGIAVQESERAARSELAAALLREAELKRRLEGLEDCGGPRAKRIRVSDYVEDRSQASTPASTGS